jgi:hypothetical protein
MDSVMTLQEAKSIARHLGLTLRKVRSGDYRVNFRDGDETTAYYTNDLEDAVNAAVEMALTADNHHAENSDHRDGAAANARLRAAIPATTATETARPMVPGGLGGERQVLRAGLRQGAASRSQKRLVPDRLARERQLLHPLKVDFEEDSDHET